MGRDYAAITPKDGDDIVGDIEIKAQIGRSENLPEPVMYSGSKTRVKCSKPLLHQLFGCVALNNLSEGEKCRERIIEQGGIHTMYIASKKLEDQTDLWMIVLYVSIA